MDSKRLMLILAAATALSGLVTLAKADYYLDTLFPIGLNGLNPTYGPSGSPPYGNTGLDWTWDDSSTEKRENKLIFDLGINCIGSQDGKPDYYVDLNPMDTSPNWNKNYLHKVCKNAPLNKPIYIITSGYYVSFPKAFKCGYYDTTPDPDTIIDTVSCDRREYGWIKTGESWGNRVAYSLFRTLYRPKVEGGVGGYGSMEFDALTDMSKAETMNSQNPCWGCHGTTYDNWNTFEGDSVWRKYIADKAVENFDSFFIKHDSLTEYFWGYNLISEEPAIYRNTNAVTPWHGCWAAVNRIFRGKNSTYRSKFSLEPDTSLHHMGIRGVEDSLATFDGGHRMIIAKGCIWPMDKANLNIFEYLPDIDAFLYHHHGWVKATWSYGDQGIFDSLLYGHYQEYATQDKPNSKSGDHYTAIYFQKYGKTFLAYPDQKRRWIAVLCLEWQGVTADGNASARRPCPPETRCAVYLSLSRGAKGVLFHPWSLAISPAFFPDNVSIPCSTEADSGEANCWVGIRDYQGWPFGKAGNPNISHHKLNNTAPQAPYWSGKTDYTYPYLADTLIPEIKLIAPTLMQLDWVNGYSLNSTDPSWSSPCPHEYVMDVSGVSYMDLGLFDHPYEPVGVEYFMLVNREGIADMTNRTVTVALDAGHWPQEDSLLLTDIADKNHPQTLKREGDRFVFTQVFEPGEGKLYRVTPEKH